MPMTAMTMPSVAKMRRMSRARAPTHRSIPISRVRSRIPIVMALTRPTMLIATITSPRTVMVVVMLPFWAMLSAFWSYQAIVVIGVPCAPRLSSSRVVRRSMSAWSAESLRIQ